MPQSYCDLPPTSPVVDSPPPVGLVPSTANGPPSPRAETAALLGVTVPQYLPAALRSELVAGDHPLKDVTDVLVAVEKIKELEAEFQATKKPRRYPKSILRHQHMVAYLLINPFASNADIAQYFSISVTTVSRLVSSDSFKQCLEQYMQGGGAELYTTIKDKMEATLSVAVDRVQEKVVQGDDHEFNLAVVDKVANRLGMGVKQQSGAGNTTNNFNIVTREMILQATQRRLNRAA